MTAVVTALIGRAYELVLAGVGPDSVAGTWNAAALPADPDGRPAAIGIRGTWTGDRVRAVLTDPVHVGREPARHRAAGLLAAPPRRPPEEPERGLLTAIADCGRCGRPVRTAAIAVGRTAYRCDDGGGRVHLARTAATVDARVRLAVLDRLTRPGAPDLLDVRDKPDLYALGAHSAGLRTRLDRVRDETGSLGTELATVEARMVEHAVRDVPTTRTGADPLPEAWDRLAVSRQRGIVLALAGSVVLHPSPPGRWPGDGDVLDRSVLITWRVD